jgi:hypothetical protein
MNNIEIEISKCKESVERVNGSIRNVERKLKDDNRNN